MIKAEYEIARNVLRNRVKAHAAWGDRAIDGSPANFEIVSALTGLFFDCLEVVDELGVMTQFCVAVAGV
jgi:hypothetical protein